MGSRRPRPPRLTAVPVGSSRLRTRRPRRPGSPATPAGTGRAAADSTSRATYRTGTSHSIGRDHPGAAVDGVELAGRRSSITPDLAAAGDGPVRGRRRRRARCSPRDGHRRGPRWCTRRADRRSASGLDAGDLDQVAGPARCVGEVVEEREDRCGGRRDVDVRVDPAAQRSPRSSRRNRSTSRASSSPLGQVRRPTTGPTPPRRSRRRSAPRASRRSCGRRRRRRRPRRPSPATADAVRSSRPRSRCTPVRHPNRSRRRERRRRVGRRGEVVGDRRPQRHRGDPGGAAVVVQHPDDPGRPLVARTGRARAGR